jgi:hypothetical protein
VKWKPEYPNTAFDNMRPDDAFWATRIVSRFSDSMIRAIVEKARYSDPRATDYMTGTLIKRRDKVVRTWLNGVNPVVDPSLNASGALAFTNLAMTANVADAPSSYMLQWFRVDNVANTRENVGEPMTVTSTTAQAPATLTAADGGAYIGVAITAAHAAHPAWAKPATFYFRRADGGWTWVGAERE